MKKIQAGKVVGLALLALVAVGGAVILRQHDPVVTSWFPACIFHQLTNLHCPGCGATRAIHALLHGCLLLESLPGPGLPAHCRGPLVAHAPRTPGPANLRLLAASPSRRRCRVCDLAQCAHTRAIMARAPLRRRSGSASPRTGPPRVRAALARTSPMMRT